jgi:hypothetical protein
VLYQLSYVGKGRLFAGGKEDFKAGEALGALSFTAQEQ